MKRKPYEINQFMCDFIDAIIKIIFTILYGWLFVILYLQLARSIKRQKCLYFNPAIQVATTQSDIYYDPEDDPWAE